VQGQSTQPVNVRSNEVSVRLGSYPGGGHIGREGAAEIDKAVSTQVLRKLLKHKPIAFRREMYVTIDE
jgi:hypothetical protein